MGLWRSHFSLFGACLSWTNNSLPLGAPFLSRGDFSCKGSLTLTFTLRKIKKFAKIGRFLVEMRKYSLDLEKLLRIAANWHKKHSTSGHGTRFFRPTGGRTPLF